ncbi:hypothetical protein JTE90_007495 [Oedothorax gibbosus]|uniref:Uncharacterized protein n=1 Tax=Oedothorax gibbosus TaxID=931172 RepID=A0AAV6VMG7_9ARAC|nr:hypothetical protein JTE90_007495 [Oedothorax gibbosus]
MLTEHLYTLFKLYITNGRIRAPPEWELRDLIPTFQRGCKTNRRAVQCKFKSWAKRMSVENGNLVLASSGKVIVPKEKYEELVMDLHSNNHMPINLIAFKIQQKYTWTKRNFGMDHEEVVKVVTSHCKKYECWRHIKNNFTKKNLPRTPFIPVPSRSIIGLADGKLKVFSLQHQPLDRISQRFRTSEFDTCSSSFRNSSAECDMLPMMPSLNSTSCNAMNNFPLHTENFSVFQEENSVSNNQNQHLNYPSSSVYMEENISMSENSRSKNQFLQALGLSRKPAKVNFNDKLESNVRSHKVEEQLVQDCGSVRKIRLSRKRSCKKIRDIIEFKRLLKSAKDNPKSFPAILMNQKTTFLGSLSLAPRQICSRKMLSKLKEEMHYQKVIRRRSLYMGKKVLRDRNKILKKVVHHKKPERFSYMKSPKSTSSCNFILPLDNTKNKRNIIGRENHGYYTSYKANALQFGSNEAKHSSVEFKSKYHTNSDVKGNNPIKDKDERFSLRNQVYLNESFENSYGSSPAQPKGCFKDMYKNTTQDLTRSNEKHFKEVQKRLDLENNSELKFSNVNDCSLKTYYVETPQPQFSFINPATATIAHFTPNTFVSGNIPLIVRPMIKAHTQTTNDTRQNSTNTSTVWSYLANGRVNILNQKYNYKPETYLQPKPLPRNTREFTENKLGKNGPIGVLIQPYRVLEPKIKISNGIEIRNITTGKSYTYNNLQKNDYFGISSRAIENSSASSTHDSNINVSISKDVDVEMKKLKKWIQRMMLNIVPCICTSEKDIETLKRDLLAELNYGINMVKEIRNAVKEAERL